MSQLYGNSDDLSTLELKSAAYYAIIPASVRYHQQLSANAKLLYGEISALTTREGYCFASNQYFADLYQVTPRSIIRMINQLETCGFIRTQEERDPSTGRVRGRRIYLAMSAPEEPPVQARADGWPEQVVAKLLEAFDGFREARRQNKHPLQSSRAVTLLCNRLAEYSGGDPTSMADMLDEATLKGWQSVYPQDDDQRQKPQETRRVAQKRWL